MGYTVAVAVVSKTFYPEMKSLLESRCVALWYHVGSLSWGSRRCSNIDVFVVRLNMQPGRFSLLP